MNSSSSRSSRSHSRSSRSRSSRSSPAAAARTSTLNQSSSAGIERHSEAFGTAPSVPGSCLWPGIVG